jgi:tetratricopeptide (TPR) repeat protein
MRFQKSRSPFVRFAPLACAALLVALPLAGETRYSAAGARFAAGSDGRSPAYRDAQSSLDQARWEEAVQRFAAVADQKNSDSDAALYWKAYAEEKIGRKAEALQTLKGLRATYPKSVWIDDAEALEVAISGSGSPLGAGPRGGPVGAGPGGAGPSPAGKGSREVSSDEQLQMYALDGLMQMDSARALPILEKILAGDRSLQIKRRALFVLGQSDEPRARTLLVSTAKSGSPAELQTEAVRSLGIAGGPENVKALSEVYRATSSRETRVAVLEAFMVAGEEKPLLEAARSESDPRLRAKGIEMLGALGATGALSDLYKSESTREVKAKILEGMMIAGDQDRLLAAARGEADRELRAKAIELLGAIGADKELVELYGASQETALRAKIIEGLMMTGNGKALVGLLRQETDPQLKKKIIQQLSMMSDDEAMDEIERLLTEKP